MNKFIRVTLATTLALLLTVPAFADGEETGGFKTRTETVCTTTYGGGTECHDEIIREEVLREFQDEGLPDTGIAEIAVVATALFLGGFAAFVLAQKQLKL